MATKSTGAAKKSPSAAKPAAAGKPKAAEKAKKPAAPEVTFICCRCEKRKPLAEMKLVTRFVPGLVVCEECARELR